MSKICQEPPIVSLCERGRVKMWLAWTQCDRMWQMHSLVSLFSCLHILSLQWLSAWGGGWKKVGVPNIRAKESSFGHRIKFRIYQYWQKRLSQKSSLILIEAPISKARYRIKDIGYSWRMMMASHPTLQLQRINFYKNHKTASQPDPRGGKEGGYQLLTQCSYFEFKSYESRLTGGNHGQAGR